MHAIFSGRGANRGWLQQSFGARSPFRTGAAVWTRQVLDSEAETEFGKGNVSLRPRLRGGMADDAKNMQDRSDVQPKCSCKVYMLCCIL